MATTYYFGGLRFDGGQAFDSGYKFDYSRDLIGTAGVSFGGFDHGSFHDTGEIAMAAQASADDALFKDGQPEDVTGPIHLDLIKYVPPNFRSDLVRRYVDAYGWVAGDYWYKIWALKDLENVDRCPDAALPLLLKQFGWDVQTYGVEVARDMRDQARSLIDFYKLKGTYRAIDALFFSLGLTGRVTDLYTDDHYSQFWPDPGLLGGMVAITGEVFATTGSDGSVANAYLLNAPTVPDSITFTDGTHTVTDDGYGNLVCTTGGYPSIIGSIRYTDSMITVEPGVLTANTALTSAYEYYKYDPLHPWFIGTQAGQAAFVENPERWKSPHFSVEVDVGAKCFNAGTSLFYADQLARLQRMVDLVRPVNTVPHFSERFVVPAVNDMISGLPMDSTVLQLGCRVSGCASSGLGDALRAQALLFDTGKAFDDGHIFEWDQLSVLRTLDRWVLGTAFTGSIADTSFAVTGTTVNQSVAGAVFNVVKNGNLVVISIAVPESVAVNGLTALSVSSAANSDRFVHLTFPPIDKVAGAVLNIVISMVMA